MRAGRCVEGLLSIFNFPAMFTLLIIGILIAVIAGIVTVQAAVTAPEGYEDHLGFHAVSGRRGGVTADSRTDCEVKAIEREVPPFVATR